MLEPFLGLVQYFAFDFAPRGWAQCNGQLLQVTSNQALFALVGTYYGGDGRTTFGLPDMRGRRIVGYGAAYPTMGAKAGAEGASMTAAMLPAHTHNGNALLQGNSNSGNASDPTGAYPAVPDSRGAIYASQPSASSFLGGHPTVTVMNAGTGSPFSIINPYIALNCCIATQGIFPSRN